ncbi:glycosyltransferase family 2 protein [Saccharopolyspora taberi]|uniref:Glycosyltransferase family 2 protein n=1 Tax=Saccharopolyspora taberi TaxID=60895 RepID=A0ABN3VEX6_9PSEU
MADERGSTVVVIVNYRTEELTLEAVRTVRDGAPEGTRVVVVDVASTPGTTAFLEEGLGNSATLVPVPENCGYGAAINRGAREGAGAAHLVAMASDCLLPGQVLRRLVSVLEEDPELGVVAPGVQRSAAGQRAKVAHEFRSVRREWDLLMSGPRVHDENGNDGRTPRWLVGACLVFRGPAFEDIGGFAEDYFMYAEDIDVCWRLQRRGWRVDTDPREEIVHLAGVSTGRTWNAAEVRRRKMRSEARFYARYLGAAEFLLLTLLRTVRVLAGRSTGSVHRRDALRLPADAVVSLVSERSRAAVAR